MQQRYKNAGQGPMKNAENRGKYLLFEVLYQLLHPPYLIVFYPAVYLFLHLALSVLVLRLYFCLLLAGCSTLQRDERGRTCFLNPTALKAVNS